MYYVLFNSYILPKARFFMMFQHFLTLQALRYNVKFSELLISFCLAGTCGYSRNTVVHIY